MVTPPEATTSRGHFLYFYGKVYVWHRTARPAPDALGQGAPPSFLRGLRSWSPGRAVAVLPGRRRSRYCAVLPSEGSGGGDASCTRTGLTPHRSASPARLLFRHAPTPTLGGTPWVVCAALGQPYGLKYQPVFRVLIVTVCGLPQRSRIEWLKVRIPLSELSPRARLGAEFLKALELGGHREEFARHKGVALSTVYRWRRQALDELALTEFGREHGLPVPPPKPPKPVRYCVVCGGELPRESRPNRRYCQGSRCRVRAHRNRKHRARQHQQNP